MGVQKSLNRTEPRQVLCTGSTVQVTQNPLLWMILGGDLANGNNSKSLPNLELTFVFGHSLKGKKCG